MTESSVFFSMPQQDATYWLVVEGQAATQLPGFTAVENRTDLVLLRTDATWRAQWENYAQQIIRQTGSMVGTRAALLAGDALPAMADILAALRPAVELSAVVAHAWLVDAIQEDRLDCYMQRVMDRRGKLVGYEAFARMEAEDGGVIGGGAIMQAAHTLKLEYQLDRALHKQAIECFVGADLAGYIFINFLTGFIHRPEIYLDGLSQAAKRMHVRAGAVVLDVPLGDYARDMAKLKSIAEYCTTRGFKLALDDVRSSTGLAALLAEIRPAFVKLDRNLGEGLPAARAQSLLEDIVRISHAHGASVLAEGVETPAQHARYMAANVDMFQGYLFGAPERFARVMHETVQSSSVS